MREVLNWYLPPKQTQSGVQSLQLLTAIQNDSTPLQIQHSLFIFPSKDLEAELKETKLQNASHKINTVQGIMQRLKNVAKFEKCSCSSKFYYCGKSLPNCVGAD